MILWTIQPETVYHDILDTGVYRCDFSKSRMQEWKAQYDWLAGQMRKQVGAPPADVRYPVWAWHTWQKGRKKPDLRNERWGNGWKGERFVRMEIEVPDSEVLLSDFDDWSIILLDGFLSDTEEEGNQLEQYYESLPADRQWEMKSENWERVFNLEPINNGWVIRGESIQATFWELKKEQIREATPFVSALPRPDYIDENGDIIPEKLPLPARKMA